jgi:hypothetical protein
VNEFVEECRKEWRRLGVPDPIANEMAADLTADLEEADAEGGSAEDVLGDSAFDPRRFPAAWASARGVTGTPIPETRSGWRPRLAIAFAAVLGALAVGTGLVLLAGYGRTSVAFPARRIITRRIISGPGPFRILGPGGRQTIIGGPFGGPFIAGPLGGIVPVIGVMLVILGVVGLGLLAMMYWWRRSGPRDSWPRPGRRTAGVT